MFKLTHDNAVQLFLFEDDAKMEYCRAWDRDYDAKMALRDSERHHSGGREKVLTFSYRTGELALAAAKRAVRENRSYTFSGRRLPDGTDCFEVRTFDGTVVERHQVK